MFVEFTYSPLIEDYYNNGELKIESILKILENAGNSHSDKAGNNVLEGSSNGFAWILTDWLVKLDFFPKYGEKIKVVTWCHEGSSPFGICRDFELYTADKLCGKGTTRWVLYDLNTQRPAKVTQDLMDRYETESKSVFEEIRLPKISVPEEFSNQQVLSARRTDIDFNHHVHNLVYIDYAMEVLPQEVFEKHDFKNIRITYKSAIKEGESFSARYALLDGQHTVCIYGADDTLRTLIALS